MKKICLLMLLVFSCFFVTGCEENSIDYVLSGEFEIADEEYDVDDLHEELLEEGWVADEYATIKLNSGHESIVTYQHNDYGFKARDFKIEVYYVNFSEEAIDILDSEIVTVLISRNNVSNYPNFGINNIINTKASKRKIMKKYDASEDAAGRLNILGNDTTRVKSVLLSFDEKDLLETIEFTLK